MAKRLYIANLDYSIDDKELAGIFTDIGSVVYARVIKDHDSDKSRGFGFIEFESDNLADDAIKTLNGKNIKGRDIVVKEANPKTN